MQEELVKLINEYLEFEKQAIHKSAEELREMGFKVGKEGVPEPDFKRFVQWLQSKQEQKGTT